MTNEGLYPKVAWKALLLAGMAFAGLLVAGLPDTLATVAAYEGFKGSQSKGHGDGKSDDSGVKGIESEDEGEDEGEGAFGSPFESLSSKLPNLGTGTKGVSTASQPATSSTFGTTRSGTSGSSKSNPSPFAEEEDAESDDLDEDL